tara:strand:- start:137 stop:640 length:504 start_codon:yes stop_codon:yes gene_type:complete
MFDWSALPNDLKIIIFKYNRLTSKNKIELKCFRKLKLNNEIKKGNNSKVIIKYNNNKCYYNDYQLGKNMLLYQLIKDLDNLCFICNKNCSCEIFNVLMIWKNIHTNTIIRDKLSICEDCDETLGCIELIQRNNSIKEKEKILFKGKLLLDIIKEEFFSNDSNPWWNY